jgi:hypothetical protein
MYLVKERRKAAIKRKKQQAVNARLKLEDMIKEKPLVVEEVKVETIEIENIEVEKDLSGSERDQNPEKNKSLIVELDESHIINSKTVN